MMQGPAEPPETIIRPPTGWQLINVAELWNFRDLLIREMPQCVVMLGAPWICFAEMRTQHLGADAQFLCDLARGESLAQEPDDFQLPVTEFFQDGASLEFL